MPSGSDFHLFEKQRDLVSRLAEGDSIDSCLILGLQDALQISRMERGGVYLLDDLSGDLYLNFSIGFSTEFSSAIQRYSSLSDRWKLFIRGKAIYSSYDQLPIKLNPTLVAEGIQTVAWLPMEHNQKLIGGLLLMSNQALALSDAEKLTLETVIAMLGLNIIRIRAQEKLETSVNKYLTILNAQTDLLFVTNLEGRFLFSNLAFQKTVGLSAGEINNLYLTDLLNGPESQALDNNYFFMLKNNKSGAVLRLKSVGAQTEEYATTFTVGMWNMKNVLIGVSRPKEAQGESQLVPQSESKYLIDLIPAALMIIDPVELNVLQGNAEFQSLFGYSEFDNKKLNILQLFSKDEYPRLIDGMKRFGLHGIETISNWQQVKRDGSTFTSQLSIHPLRWMNENCFLVLITPQEKGEKPLYRIQEERYREVVNKQIDLIVRFTREGMITFVNQAFCEFSQQSAEQLIGRPVGERIHEADVEIFQRHLSLISTQQPIRKSQNRMIDGFGRLRTIQWLDRGIFDGDQLLEFQGVGQDISEAVSEQILKETMEQRYRGLVEEIQGVVYLLHAETFMIIYINPQFEKLSGYSLEEIYQDPSLWEKSIPPDDMLRIRASLQNRRRQIAGEIIEFQFRHKDGHIIWAQERGSLIVSNDGTAFLQGVVVDISAAQVARQKLELYSRLGRALNDFSLALMKVKAEQWNGLVNAILEEIGKELQMDRAYILMIDFEQETVNNTHEWCADGIESSMGDFQNLPLHQFDWWAEHLQQDGKIIIEDLSTLLPAEAAIREMMESQSVQSILVVALKLEDQYYGCIGFDSVKTPKIFDQEVIPILRIFSDMLMSTYERLGLGRFQPTDFSPTN